MIRFASFAKNLTRQGNNSETVGWGISQLLQPISILAGIGQEDPITKLSTRSVERVVQSFSPSNASSQSI
ncbi:MAG: hypothetical protein ACK56G_05130, partial [Pirellulaceae bacterium]